MSNKLGSLVICLCTSGLAACVSNGPQNYYTRYSSYQPYAYQDTQFYSQGGYNGTASYGELSQTYPENSMSESYYTGSAHSPISHKDIDRNWVNGQNPRGYTIEIGESDKASQVAGKLHKVPKNDRMAEIKYNRDGKAYYKGVYGSYNNYEEAQKALNNLPLEIKQGADIKNWSHVQENVRD